MKDNKTESAQPIGLMAEKLPEPKIYRWELESLKRQLINLERQVNTLTVVNDVIAKNFGMKIEKYDGVVVITTI